MIYFHCSFSIDLKEFLELESVLSENTESLSVFESQKVHGKWAVDLIISDNKLTLIKNLLKKKEKDIKDLNILEVDNNTNWLKKSYESFEPVTIGSFYIHGSHLKKIESETLYPVCIDAATAFGSGEHETTQGCIMNMEDLKNSGQLEKKHILDLGCGTGILSIVAKILWPKSEVWSVDSDEESVSICKKYTQINKLQISVFQSCGFQSEKFKNSKFNLIIANILANPLIALSSQIRKHIADNGYIILSGILKEQEKLVLEHYEKEGFKLIKRRTISNWVALTLSL